MKTEDTGHIKGTTGNRAGEGEPLLPVHAFTCCDNPPHPADYPPLTNGGLIRTMDNHQLAKLAVRIAKAGPLTETQYFDWLGQPSAACMAHALAVENET
ncbi:MAG: hypothetical protein IJT94_16870 [Oscillibacter sp.]|nr:hypothetical protein [Oscillibacter sp.]